jgi:hypothetical protein
MLSALERAMPQCLDGSFEIQVANYMSQLLGNRSRERRTELRLAQQMLDGARGDGMPIDHLTGSSGSLRALAVGGDAKPQEDSQALRKTAVEIRVTPAPATVHPRRPRLVTRARIVAAGAAIAGVLAIVVAMQSMHAPGELAAPAPSPVPAAAVVPNSEPRSEPPPRPAPQPPVSATVQPAPTAEDVKEGAGAKRGAKKTATPTPRASATPPAAPANTAANGAPPASERPRPETRDASNAWDPGTFGGRR